MGLHTHQDLSRKIQQLHIQCSRVLLSSEVTAPCVSCLSLRVCLSSGLLATVPTNSNGNRNGNSDTGFAVEASHETPAPSGEQLLPHHSCWSVAVTLCLMKKPLV